MNRNVPFVWIAMVFFGCDAPEPPTGIPRCEPAAELQVERRLKLGFRYLYEGEHTKARGEFEGLLEQEPSHPEALLGLRYTEGVSSKRKADGDRSWFTLAGRLIPASLKINPDRYSYESELQGKRLRQAAGDGVKDDAKTSFSSRTNRLGKKVSFDDLALIQKELNLVVFHDSLTVNAPEFFYSSAMEGRSSHFMVDTDGFIFQSLDLGHRAHHCGIEEIERRSIVITMINPMESSVPQTDQRELSAPGLRHGRKVTHWGYTPAQRRSVKRLTASLVAAFPNLNLRLPNDEMGRVPSGLLPIGPGVLKGLAGHFHINEEASDPSVAFPWDGIKRYRSLSDESR
jgi:N-acetyl-anhydromuramyl-L-alanine amidase AmpD